MQHKHRSALFHVLTILSLLVIVPACAGEQGPAGPVGPQGPKGADGAPGRGLIGYSYCAGAVDYTGTGSGALVDYSVYDFADGSTMTSCSVADAEFAVHNMRLFKATQQGANVGGCDVIRDADASHTLGQWSFTISADNKTATVKYIDPTSPYNGKTFSIPCALY